MEVEDAQGGRVKRREGTVCGMKATRGELESKQVNHHMVSTAKSKYGSYRGSLFPFGTLLTVRR